MFDHADDIRGMATPSTFGMIGVNSPVLESSNCGLDKSRLVEGIGVNEGLDVEFLANSETSIDRGWRATPILVELQSTRSGYYLFS